jgi:hypothetical protein
MKFLLLILSLNINSSADIEHKEKERKKERKKERNKQTNKQTNKP